MISFLKRNYLIIIILIISVILRLFKLADYPVGFHIDEASLGYNGYSLLVTGKDEHGNRFPLYIDMFGDNRPSGYHFLVILPIYLFGLNEFATRLPGALYGVISVLCIYILSYTVFHHKKVALVASFLTAISPWSVNLSRASSESIVALCFITIGEAQIIRSLKSANITALIVGSLIISISFFYYHSPRIFVPVLFVVITIINFKSIINATVKYKITILLSFVYVCLLAYTLIFSISGGTGRFNQVSIFNFPETRLVMEEQFREDGTQKVNLLFTRILHNKPVNYLLTFLANYFDYFTGQFMFVKGGLPIWYRIPNIGLLYLAELPFLVLGLFYLFFRKNIHSGIMISWLLISPLVAAITSDDIPNIQRAIYMFPVLEMITGYGLVMFLANKSNSKKILIIGIFSIAIIFNFIYFIHQYFIHGKSHQTLYRNNGFKEMVLTVKTEYDKNDIFVITKSLGGIYPLVLFFMKYDPFLYQAEGSNKDRDFKGFGKIIFTPQICPSNEELTRYLVHDRVVFVNNGTCDISEEEKIKIYREDGTLAFVIVYRNFKN